ncbi:MAG TPA: hypothetical protein DDY34_12405 [Bacteroidales bacterium]|nr:hypothetical protein [Bacteroidales bacterium]HBH84597.1 hypothetical protein [Bacteroidales bacterium]HBQ83890.1 hypothetical protein [Bacteroidales bacterium]HCU20971.1 hypothetical protein [Bacteroidales bacterium]
MLDVLINQAGDNSSSKGVKKISDRADKPIKSVMKAISWRIVGTIDTIIISYFITGKLTMALTIGGVEVFTKVFLYYLHERVWSHIHKINIKFWERTNDKRYEVKGVEKAAFRKVG